MAYKYSGYKSVDNVCVVGIPGGRYISTIQDVDVDERFMKEPVKFERKALKVLAKNRFGSSSHEKKGFC